MKRIVCICLLILLLGIPCLNSSLHAEETSGIQATAPDMPLLKSWLAALERGEVPRATGDRSALVTLPFAEINRGPIEVQFLTAKLYNGKADLVAMISYNPEFKTKTQYTKLLYRDKQGLHIREWAQQDGWLWLVENKGPAMAMKGDFAHVEGTALPPGNPVLIHVQDKRITTGPLSPSDTISKFQQQYFWDYDDKRKIPIIRDGLTAKPIVDVPKREEATGRGQLRPRQVGDKLVLAGLKEARKGGEDLIWLVQPKGTTMWQAYRKPIDQSYLQSFLPPSLQGMQVVREQEERVEVWKDGSIVFRLQCQQKQNGDRLSGLFLIMQPLQGKPRLLSWEVIHSYEPSGSHNDDSYIARNKRAASNTFRHSWFPAEGGQIAKRFIRTTRVLRNDFFFDVDVANDVVIYLLGGQLWAVDLSDQK